MDLICVCVLIRIDPTASWLRRFHHTPTLCCHHPGQQGDGHLIWNQHCPSPCCQQAGVQVQDETCRAVHCHPTRNATTPAVPAQLLSHQESSLHCHVMRCSHKGGRPSVEEWIICFVIILTDSLRDHRVYASLLQCVSD